MRALPHRVHIKTKGRLSTTKCDGCGQETTQHRDSPRLFERTTAHAEGCIPLWTRNFNSVQRCWACHDQRHPPHLDGDCVICDGRGWLPRERPLVQEWPQS